MKKVINDKIYDTETATQIYSVVDFDPYNTMAAWSEELYITNSGAFFLYYEGGQLSKYAGECNGNLVSSENIRLLDSVEAERWCERNNADIEIIKQYFKLEQG